MAEQLGHVVLTFAFERGDNNNWVGTCLELGTSTYANSLQEVEEALHELVTEHLSLLEQYGERERFFREWGIELHQAAEPSEEIFARVLGKAMTLRDYGDAYFQPRTFPLPMPTIQEPAVV